MSAPFQGAPGPSGYAGLRPASGQLAVSRNHTVPKPVLIIVVAADVARTIDIPSTQETDCKTA
jgi:hypothetical protein